MSHYKKYQQAQEPLTLAHNNCLWGALSAVKNPDPTPNEMLCLLTAIITSWQFPYDAEELV